MTLTVVCMFSCEGCGLKKVKVEVRAREPGESITAWMHTAAIVALSEAHRRLSPKCRASHLQNVYIPVSPGENGQIGGVTRQ